MRKQSYEIFLLITIALIFIIIRSIHFPLYVNFAQDQAVFSIEALKIARDKSLSLIGPAISLNVEGRQIFQGPAIYYFQLLFLKLGTYNPLVASYLFMIFSALMIFPLYYGVKLLVNKKVAFIIITLYTLLPYYINYTRFLWNPNFQLSLLPLLILLMGIFKKTRRKLIFLLISISAGFLLQFHYQFIVIIIGLLIYYFVRLRVKYYYLAIFVIGLLIGFFPLILFEIRHNFYNLQTIVFYIYHSKSSSPINLKEGHYFLSISLFSFIVLFSLIPKLNRFFLILFTALFFYSLMMYLPKPAQSFRTIKNWSYPDEEKVYQIIKMEKLSNFNIVNLSYDSKAMVQKYFLQRDNYHIDFDNYHDNKFLFVVNSDDTFMNNPAYEVNTFIPSIVIQKWQINPFHNLYLLERIN